MSYVIMGLVVYEGWYLLGGGSDLAKATALFYEKVAEQEKEGLFNAIYLFGVNGTIVDTIHSTSFAIDLL